MKNTIKILSALVTILCIFTLTGCGLNGNPGNGEKVGQVVKLNNEGLIRTTWEAELIRGGMNEGSGSFGTTPFYFTIEDRETAKKVQDYLQNQTEVIIKYRMEGIYSLFRTSSGGHFLESIEPVPNSLIQTNGATRTR